MLNANDEDLVAASLTAEELWQNMAMGITRQSVPNAPHLSLQLGYQVRNLRECARAIVVTAFFHSLSLMQEDVWVAGRLVTAQCRRDSMFALYGRPSLLVSKKRQNACDAAFGKQQNPDALRRPETSWIMDLLFAYSVELVVHAKDGRKIDGPVHTLISTS